jgi:hypothetical protein
MKLPRLTIRSLMVATAIVACVLGLGLACIRLLASSEEPTVVLDQGTTFVTFEFVTFEFVTSTVIYELPPVGLLALLIVGAFVVGMPLGIYLLNRRRDRRRNHRR